MPTQQSLIPLLLLLGTLVCLPACGIQRFEIGPCTQILLATDSKPFAIVSPMNPKHGQLLAGTPDKVDPTAPVTLTISEGWRVEPKTISPDSQGNIALLLKERQEPGRKPGPGGPNEPPTLRISQDKWCYTLQFTRAERVLQSPLKPEGERPRCEGSDIKKVTNFISEKPVPLDEIQAFISSDKPATIHETFTTINQTTRQLILRLTYSCQPNANTHLLIGGPNTHPLLLPLEQQRKP